MITAMVLSDDTRGISFPLIPNDSIRVAGFEVTAAVREVMEDLAGADGVLDSTTWLSAAAVTIDLTAVASINSVLDSIGVYLAPWARPYLTVTDDTWVSPRKIRVRFDSHTHPYELPTYRAVQLAFKAPRGVWEDTAAQVWQLGADVPDVVGLTMTATTGLAMTDTSGAVMGASTGTGNTIVTVNGNARPAWRARLYGPATGPQLTREDLNQSVVFTDSMILGEGDYLEIALGGPNSKQALLQSDVNSNRVGFLDFSQTTWFPLDPGSNQLRYHATAGTTASSRCEVVAWPVWMP